MKSKFLYPTKLNTLIGFITCQVFPIAVLENGDKLGNFWFWIAFELIILSILAMWRIKPDSELDEREKDINLKWKSRMLDWGSSLIIIPLSVLAINPGVTAWNLFSIGAIPVFLVVVLCSLMSKKEMGYFFHRSS